MGRGYGPLVALYTAFSVCGLAWRMNSTLLRARQHSGLLSEDALQHVQAAKLLQSLFQSSLTTALFANLVVNFFILVALFTKALFFGRLSLMETQKLVERLINYVIFKGLFLALIAQPDIMQIALWLIWFAVLGFLKMFQGLARDRLERLNASPAATVFSHMRVFAVLVLILLSDFFWIQLCLLIFKDNGISTLFLLLFEPLSIAFETLQAVLVHGMQLVDTWHRHISDVAPQCSGLQPSERSAAGAAWEWRGTVVRNCSFIMDILSLLLALGHCLHIWWLRGLAFQVVDGVLFLNLRALLSAILKRIKGFMRVRTATNTLQGALPDASHEELLAYEDDCAICKEPMARAKRLPCAHLFHLPCLRSWLDQGLAETYSCPTCRRPLFMRSARTATLQVGQQFLDGDQMARTLHGMGQQGSDDPQILGDMSRQAEPNPPIGSFGRQQWNAALNNTWSSLPVGPTEGDGPSAESGTRGLRRMQAMMRQLIGGGRSHTPTEASEPSGSWWPFANRIGEVNSVQSSATTSRQALFATGFQNQNGFQGFRNRGPVNVVNARGPHMGAMVSMVREVLPDMPEDIIIQDLRRTNSVTATVNNLL